MNEITIRTEKTFKSKALNEATKALYNAFLNIETGRKEACKVLAIVERDKSYKADGFKSLAEYAEQIGLEKSLAHKMENAGRLLISEVPQVKQFAEKADYSKLAILSSAKEQDVASAIDSGDLKPGMTSKEVTTWKTANVNKDKPAEIVANYDVTIIYGDGKSVKHENTPIEMVKELVGYEKVGFCLIDGVKWVFMYCRQTYDMLRYAAVKVKAAKTAPKLDLSKLSDEAMEMILKEYQRRKSAQ